MTNLITIGMNFSPIESVRTHRYRAQSSIDHASWSPSASDSSPPTIERFDLGHRSSTAHNFQTKNNRDLNLRLRLCFARTPTTCTDPRRSPETESKLKASSNHRRDQANLRRSSRFIRNLDRHDRCSTLTLSQSRIDADILLWSERKSSFASERLHHDSVRHRRWALVPRLTRMSCSYIYIYIYIKAKILVPGPTC